MHSPVQHILHFLLLAVLLGGVYYISQNADSFRTDVAHILNVSPKVLGVSTRMNNPAEEIKKDITDQIELVKEQALDIRVGDIITTMQRAQKVKEDVEEIKTFVEDKAREFLERKN